MTAVIFLFLFLIRSLGIAQNDTIILYNDSLISFTKTYNVGYYNKNDQKVKQCHYDYTGLRFCDRYDVPGFSESYVRSYYSGKSCFRKSHYQNNMLNGFGYDYFDNGNIKAKYQFKNNVFDGKYERWYDNKMKKEEKYYSLGKLNGVYYNFCPDGRVISIDTMVNDVRKNIRNREIPDSVFRNLKTLFIKQIGDSLFNQWHIKNVSYGIQGYVEYPQIYGDITLFYQSFIVKIPYMDIDKNKHNFDTVNYYFNIYVSTCGEILTNINDVLPNCKLNPEKSKIISQKEASKAIKDYGKNGNWNIGLELYQGSFCWVIHYDPIIHDSGKRYIINANNSSILSVESEYLSRPVCLPANALIETPTGKIEVNQLQDKMFIYSQNINGERIVVPILLIQHSSKLKKHKVIKIQLADGRNVIASPMHPINMINNFENIEIGEEIDGAKVIKKTIIKYHQKYTYDVLPDGETGFYWVNDVKIKSSLFDINTILAEQKNKK